ncbi:hypothetical protein AKJ16_DCAP11284 [Drosera capensis]
MLKFPSSVTTIPISSLVLQPSTNPHKDEHVLAIEESDYEEKVIVEKWLALVRVFLYGIPLFGERLCAVVTSHGWCQSVVLNDIRKMNSNLPIIGRTIDNDKENFDNDVDDDDDGDNVDESEGEFEQEAR